MKVIVIGGGIGGLATAIALRRVGIEPRVFERATDLQAVQIGAGLHLWSNAMRALGILGLADKVEAAATETKRFQQRTWRGALLGEWPVSELRQRLGAPTVGVTRPDLHLALSGAVDERDLELGTEFTGFEQDASGVTVRFADGREERADVLVGADGGRSRARGALLGPDEPRYAGLTSWRGLVDFDRTVAPPGLFQLFWGKGKVFIIYRVGGGRLYWLGFKRAPAGERDDGPPNAALLDDFRGWQNPIEDVIEATEGHAITRTDIYDRTPVKKWGEGRVTLLGDAAHAMTPHLGQGAATAIEDAVVLAKCLSENGDVVEALRRYEQPRMARTAHFTKISRAFGRAGRWRNPLLTGFRDLLIRLVFDGPIWKSQQKDLDFKV